jgi:hypothetical protein
VALEALAEQDVGASVVEPNDETHQGKHNAVMAVLDLRNAVEAAPWLRQGQLENRTDGSNSWQEDSSNHAGIVDPPAEPVVFAGDVEDERGDFNDWSESAEEKLGEVGVCGPSPLTVADVVPHPEERYSCGISVGHNGLDVRHVDNQVHNPPSKAKNSRNEEHNAGCSVCFGGNLIPCAVVDRDIVGTIDCQDSLL